ncbi:hypothetical protein Ahy_B04g070749 [Arachis hypogaea]|uniref:Uncharacterized protein n=2 Tax=Arachis TaxID=3817 RepID=A0A444ZIR1_ARAHY|nr:hypothetical protein Ahy_B04g070749 [Arachis hypogaea]
MIFSVGVRYLTITWGNQRRFWKEFDNISDPFCGLGEAKLLVQVNWLEVTGKLSMGELKRHNGDSIKTYEIFYVVSFNEDAYGWHSAPVKFTVKPRVEPLPFIEVNLEEYRKKHGQWHEISGGRFPVSGEKYVEFGMYEVETAWWKGGMHLAGVIIKAVNDDDQTAHTKRDQQGGYSCEKL